MTEPTGNPGLSESASPSGETVAGRPLRGAAAVGVAAVGPGLAAAQGDYGAAMVAAAPTFTLGLLFFFGVVCPAVWSRKPQRQKAALGVMDVLIGRTSRSRRMAK